MHMFWEKLTTHSLGLERKSQLGKNEKNARDAMSAKVPLNNGDP